MIRILIVGAGGFLGTVFRFMLIQWVHKILSNPWYPYGTLTVNVIGSLLMGFLAGLAQNKGLLSSEMRLFLMIGILGGFTTFSTFSYETLALLRDAQMTGALMNIALSVILSLGAVFAGYQISNLI
jgi:fluoride exporter